MVGTVFVVVVSYVIGVAMQTFLPSKGWLGRIINPGPVCREIHPFQTYHSYGVVQPEGTLRNLHHDSCELDLFKTHRIAF